MLLYLNQKEINPSILCNKFDFQPYLSTYVNEPLDNAKNVTNVSFNVGNTLVSKVLTPSVQPSTVLVKTNLMNTTNISAVKGKINHKPVADFEYSFVDGDIVLNNLSVDPDGDALAYNWSISDDVNFDGKNVKYRSCGGPLDKDCVERVYCDQNYNCTPLYRTNLNDSDRVTLDFMKKQ